MYIFAHIPSGRSVQNLPSINCYNQSTCLTPPSNISYSWLPHFKIFTQQKSFIKCLRETDIRPFPSVKQRSGIV